MKIVEYIARGWRQMLDSMAVSLDQFNNGYMAKNDKALQPVYLDNTKSHRELLNHGRQEY